MSITIRECLKLPSLSMGKVIAGHGGLDNIVTTVSVMEFNDTDEQDILSPNELLISALFCVKDDVDAQCKLITKACNSGDAGLVLFYTDFILGKINQKLIRVANHLNFPIIVMPETDMGLKYSDVISDVTEAIYSDRSSENYFVSDTIQTISQLPENKRTVSLVLKLASSYAKAAFFLCDEHNNLISMSFWPSANHLNFKDVLNKYESQNDSILPNSKVFRRKFYDKKGTPLILYSATQNNRLNSTMLNEVTEAIQLFSLLWNYNLNLDTPEALIPAILKGKSELVSHISNRNNLKAETFNKIVVIEGADSNLMLLIKKLFNDFQHKIICDYFEKYLILIYENDYSIKDSIIDGDLDSILMNTATLSTYTSYTSPKLLETAPEFFSLYCGNLPTLKVIFPYKKRFSYSDVFFASRANATIALMESQYSYYHNLLVPIIEHPEKELLATLVTYLLDCDSEIKTTAETIFVHRNTVMYRLNKIKSILGYDVDKMPMAYDLFLSAAIYRIQNSSK